MAEESLCVGDTVCLFSKEAHGYAFSYQTSSLHAQLAVESRQDIHHPAVPDPQVTSFVVTVANRYKLNKKYRKLVLRCDAAPDDLGLKTKADVAQVGAQAEDEDNIAEQTRQRGKKLTYGHVIQLQHVFTGKFVHVSTTQTSMTESSNMKISLSEWSTKHAQFRLMPRYKVKSEGDIVQDGDQIVLESIKSPGQFLHVSKGRFSTQAVYKGNKKIFLWQGSIGLVAARMMMELVKDNRKIVDRISHEHINMLVKLLQKKKDHRYLDLLSVLCVCDGVSIPDNQTYITDVWLKANAQTCVFHTEIGQTINKDHNVVYVSKDNQETWMALHDFLQDVQNIKPHQERDLTSDEEFHFLDHQLDLFGKLCFGRNSYAISVITKDLKYLTWEEAFLCLTNENLPDQLRAKYCHLIIGLFVDVGENSAVLDRMNLTYIYDEIGKDKVTDVVDDIAREKSITKKYFPVLRDWISNFLDNTKDMTASEIGHNMLVEQVLALVHYLAKFGYYETMDDVKQLLEPLLSLLDGRNDKPYPVMKGEITSSEVLRRYQDELRYTPSPETKAIVDAKFQAMEVLELFLNYRFNIRLETFVGEFKHTHTQANHVVSSHQGQQELMPMLRKDYNIHQQKETNEFAVKRLRDLFKETEFFADYDIKEVLMDLSHYEYDQMVVKSMSLLNRYFSAHDNLFKRAVQAQVLITDQSATVLKELHEILPVMQRLTAAKMSQEQTKTMETILDRLIELCRLENEPDENHSMNQNIIYNQTILETIFDILSQEIDIRLLEQYKGTQRIFQKAFVLLKVMARNNDIVQQRLFDRLDMLLNIEGAEPQMAEALTEVFTGNKHACLKVLSHQVQKIMSLSAVHTNKVPQFLDLLNALVKVEELNLPLKRNQGYVMKYFMQYRSEVAHVIDQAKEDRLVLLESGTSPDLDYMTALVDLMATCAEGENRFVESFCQTIFSVKELLQILCDRKIDNMHKSPYVRFVLWVYLNTASGMIESGAGDLPHDSLMWQYVTSLQEDLNSLTKYATSSPDTVKQLLKKPPHKIRRSAECLDGLDAQHGSLHYILDAVMPFLQVFVHSYFQPSTQHPEEADHVDDLATALMAFTKAIGPLVSNPQHMGNIVSCMNVVLTSSTLPVNVMEEFRERFGNAQSMADICSEERCAYTALYRQEEHLNATLNVFASNFSAAYRGLNTVRAQIGFNSEREYSEVGGDEELPLGQEFQDHIACFVNKTTKNTDDKYHLTDKLVNQLQISASLSALTEKDRLNQEALDIKCLQLLRGIIHNQTVRLPEDWESFPKENRKHLVQVAQIQNALNAHGAVLKVLPHLSKTDDDIVCEVLAFLAAMLFCGNESVQGSLIKYFLGTREDSFLFAIKHRMQMSGIATKENRSLMAQHQAKVDEAVQQARGLREAMKAGRLQSQQQRLASNLGNLLRDQSNLGNTLLNGSLSSSLSSITVGHKNAGRDQLESTRLVQGPSAYNGRLASQHSADSYGSMEMGTPGAFKLKALNGQLLQQQSIEEEEVCNNKHGEPVAVKPMKNKGKTKLQKTAKQLSREEADETEVRQMALALSDTGEVLDYKDDGYITLVLRILGLMCDGQNKQLQDYLREQPDNMNSVNLIAETAQFLGLIYSTINYSTAELVMELFNTLVEFTSGNPTNQSVVYENKICDYINYILRTSAFNDCKPKQVMLLKKSISSLIIAMIEENPRIQTEEHGKKKSVGMSLNVAQTLDSESIWQVSMDCYESCLIDEVSNKGNPKTMKKSSSLNSELNEQLLRLGFNYFLILKRIVSLDEDGATLKARLLKTRDSREAWDYYECGTMSVEVIKDNELNRIYFRCKNKSVLREDVKQKFKYAVDRSSPSSKLREFVDWSKDIMADIKYTQGMLANPMTAFFIRFWSYFNYGMVFVSFIFCILILVTWRQPLHANGKPDLHNWRPRLAYNEVVVSAISYALGGIHNVLTLCVLISYFIINHPTIPICGFCRRMKREDEDDDEMRESRPSNLDVKFFSFSTFWYSLLFAFSILGTAFYGYFFSFHLLHLAQFSQLLSRAIRAVTKNGVSLLLVFAYGLVFFFIYALISFAIYREQFDSKTGLYCETMYECFLTLFHRGLILDTFEFLLNGNGEPFTFYLHRALFDLSFFIIISTIGLNIIFGIIIDTFGELRNEKWCADNSMASSCFICSRSSYDFEKQGKGFAAHVKEEHNQWAYLFFFIHLDETRPNDYTSLEMHVSKLLERESYDFFPLNRALSLQHEENSNEQKIETLMKHVNYVVAYIKGEEINKEKEEEKRKQIEWAKQHR